MIVLALISLALLGIARYTQWMSPVRYYLDTVSIPFYWLTHIPTRINEWVDYNVSSREDLVRQNESFREKVLVQQAELQKMGALINENIRLRELMNSSALIQNEVLIAELIGISPDTKVHKVIVNKGSSEGVYIGQAVLDAYGLMGQVVAVTPYTSEVLFITDDSHAIPVQINRNGVRTVVEGIGDLYRLRLRYVSSTIDIIEGDLLVSSGLGGRFPAGYPVATVQSIRYEPGESFVTVYATPTAELNRSLHVLLVFREGQRSVSVDGELHLPDTAK